MKSILRVAFVIAMGLAFNAVVGELATGCSAELANLKADPGGVLTSTATHCAPAALQFGSDVATAVDQGGANWFTDFQSAIDVLKGFECVETQLRAPSTAVPAGLTARTMAEVSITRPTAGEIAAAKTPLERRAIALRELRWRKTRAELERRSW